MQKVADGIQADIPDEMVDVQAQQMMENFQQQLAAQGIPFDQYLKMTNTTEDDFKKQAHEPALQQVRMDLAVAALVKAEELEATAEEIEAEMKSVADKYGMDLDTIKKYLPSASRSCAARPSRPWPTPPWPWLPLLRRPRKKPSRKRKRRTRNNFSSPA